MKSTNATLVVGNLPLEILQNRPLPWPYIVYILYPWTLYSLVAAIGAFGLLEFAQNTARHSALGRNLVSAFAHRPIVNNQHGRHWQLIQGQRGTSIDSLFLKWYVCNIFDLYYCKLLYSSFFQASCKKVITDLEVTYIFNRDSPIHPNLAYVNGD